MSFFLECLWKGTYVSMYIQWLVLFPLFIFQDLIGDDFRLSFHTVCLVHHLPSRHWSRDGLKFLYIKISSFINKFFFPESQIQCQWASTENKGGELYGSVSVHLPIMLKDKQANLCEPAAGFLVREATQKLAPSPASGPRSDPYEEGPPPPPPLLFLPQAGLGHCGLNKHSAILVPGCLCSLRSHGSQPHRSVLSREQLQVPVEIVVYIRRWWVLSGPGSCPATREDAWKWVKGD